VVTVERLIGSCVITDSELEHGNGKCEQEGIKEGLDTGASNRPEDCEVLHESGVPQVAKDESEDEQVQEKHHHIVSKVCWATGTYNTFHF